jgi:hypothetical protein
MLASSEALYQAEDGDKLTDIADRKADPFNFSEQDLGELWLKNKISSTFW